ncbi:MAG: DUF222 domain-containing protein [Acidimicrobiales bacterium]
MAATAKRLESLPRTAEALAEGAITFEHAEQVAKAADTVTAERADAELAEQAKAAPADVFGKRSREWSTKHREDDGTEEYERHRRDRRVTKWVGDDGMAMVLAALDKPTGDAVAKVLEQRAEELWRDDGGRDGDPAEMRTLDQRMADALVELITGNHSEVGRSAASAASTQRDRRHRRPHRPVGPAVGVTRCRRGTAAQSRARPDPLHRRRDGDAVRRTRTIHLGRTR